MYAYFSYRPVLPDGIFLKEIIHPGPGADFEKRRFP
jgi:hypothetical protein